MRRIGELAVHGELLRIASRVRPRGPTPSEYRAWRAAQPPVPTAQRTAWFVIALDHPVAAFATPPHGAACVVARGVGGGWMRAGDDRERPLGDWLRETGAAWIWWIGDAATPAPDAGDALARACGGDARIVYGDHETADGLALKPAWDREQIVERDYAGPTLVVHADFADAVDAAVGAGARWATLIKVATLLTDAAIVHVPRVLASLPTKPDEITERAAVAALIVELGRTRGDDIDADPTRTPWIRYRAPVPCSVSIVIPIRDRPELLARCVRAIDETGFPADGELVIVDNGSIEPATAALLDDLHRRRAANVIRIPGPFNFPKLCNRGVEVARGRAVVLLNNDTVVTSGWLEELVSLAARRPIGAVGPLLLYPDGRVQSAGVLAGVNRTATSALEGFVRDDPVARDWCATRRRITAVAGACIAVERDKYLQVGGMDERFAVSHNEVDFCLRLEAAGLANLFTPFACVVHEEGATRGFELMPEERHRLAREEALFRARWGDVLERVDPAHHPAFAREGNAFALTPVARDDAPRSGWRAPPLPLAAAG